MIFRYATLATRAQSTSALPPKADIAGKPALSPQSREYSSQGHRAFYQARLDHRQFAHLRRWATCVLRLTRFARCLGHRIGALRIAARFFDRSTATKTFQRGIDAHRHPQFYRQLGKVPQELVTAALALLQKRFDLR